MKRKIDGTFFEFRHHNTAEGKYWNSTLDTFTAEQWRQKVREISEIGMEYIVVMSTALNDRCYFTSQVYPFADIPCSDPIEAVLSEADELNLKVFLGNGFYGDWRKAGTNIRSKEVIDRSFRAMEELTALYAHHKSFYGWYYPDETCIILNYPKQFVNYVNSCTERCRLLTPEKKSLIAPYGTNLCLTNDYFVKTLANLDVDFVAYQDEVGVKKTRVGRTANIFERLCKAHDRAGRSKLWADIELFDFEGMVYKSALVPADFERIEKQIENVAPYADKILCYQFQGMMNPQCSLCFSGHPDSARLYEMYMRSFNK